MEIVYVVITGLFTLGGVWIGNRMSSRDLARARQADYAREALSNLRSYADQMEYVGRNVLLLLVGLHAGFAKDERKALRRSFVQIQGELRGKSWMPQIADEKVSECWQAMNKDFGRLLLAFQILNPSLNFASTPRTRDTSKLVELLRLSVESDPNQLAALLSPDPADKEIFNCVSKLLQSIQGLRQAIAQAATK
jgi:hypothetical protein